MATYNLLPNDICEVILAQTYQDQQLFTVLHYQFRGPTLVETGREEVEALINKLSDIADPNQIIGAFTAAQVATLNHDYIQGQIVAATRKPYSFKLVGLGGDQPGPGLPANVACVITKQGVVPGRGKAGSVHVGGIASSQISAGLVVNDQLTTLDTLGGRLSLTVPTLEGITHNWVPVIWSARNPTAANDLFSIFPQDTARVMRRRTLRVGI